MRNENKAMIAYYSTSIHVPILGYLLFKDFCENVAEEPIPQIKFYEEVRKTIIIMKETHEHAMF